MLRMLPTVVDNIVMKLKGGCSPIDELNQRDEAEAKAGSYQPASLGEETNLHFKS